MQVIFFNEKILKNWRSFVGDSLACLQWKSFMGGPRKINREEQIRITRTRGGRENSWRFAMCHTVSSCWFELTSTAGDIWQIRLWEWKGFQLANVYQRLCLVMQCGDERRPFDNSRNSSIDSIPPRYLQYSPTLVRRTKSSRKNVRLLIQIELLTFTFGYHHSPIDYSAGQFA